MKLLVNPNRMELLKLKRRQVFALRGHKLLKDKQESLMQQFMRLIKELRQLYAGVEQMLNKTYESYYQAQVGSDPFVLEEAVETSALPLKIDVLIKNSFGVKVPTFTLKNIKKEIGYSPATAPLALDKMLDQMQELLPQLIQLVQLEKQIELLALEIEKTRRRVNALEYNMIPALQEAIRSIVMKLEERDRSERTTLVKVKEMLEAGR